MARSFNGSTDVINNASGLNQGTPLSIHGWINPSSLTDGNVLSSHSGGAGFGLRATGRLFTALSGIAYLGASISVLVSANVWTAVGVTWLDNTVAGTIFYANGVPNANTDATTTTAAITNWDMGSTVTGALADLAIWSDVLTAQEMKALGTGAARPYQVRPSILQGWWPLDGIQSPEPDLSGHAFNGTLTGTALAAGPPVTMFTPRQPQFLPPAAPAPASFRGSLSSLGTRTGARQIQGDF